MSRFFHHVSNSAPYPEERPCNANKKGVKMQCIRQSALAIAPTVSGLFSLKLIIEFFYVNWRCKYRHTIYYHNYQVINFE